MKPLVIINFKLYPEAVGRKAVALAVRLSKQRFSHVQLAFAPPLSTLSEIRTKTTLPLFAQHADPVPLGAYTGHLSPEELRRLGIQGTLLNHSERKFSPAQVKKTILLCKKNKLITIVCAASLNEAKKLAMFSPDYIAYEPPALIGGNVSVTKAKPGIITKVVALIQKTSPKTKLLCGAGIHSSEDLQKALQLGMHGVLIGHAVPKAKDPLLKVKQLIS
ncbi:triose-phosphate isomerase [Candidatus Woesearchaeota archaeon]|nr:triose-phosphate isomerase [Candidatus Woesearchaeota archaeon]